MDKVRDIKLEKGNMDNFYFRFPNNAMLDASMTHLLLWEILSELKKGKQRDKNGKPSKSERRFK